MGAGIFVEEASVCKVVDVFYTSARSWVLLLLCCFPANDEDEDEDDEKLC